ncbi:MAG: hypothetical protein COX83_02845 [Candidatus Magasanikbacteria bacterium CG_4_10_14_0_2_um_filter_41_31]|uniref:SbsA Ig-like domain-containing protein n=1 Tax=Candidatus Magasanikbacteria bacterium CG_4_10_14_0_2_um_filter_41_31 TaxID=1974639 RepID=A0A2M7V3J4_9BACT|nr:MAG: hypothetical protein COX83_02845 [Candidatus Magasanikbacteria bacterium CG_4_10_14_0_2_um_filter_41_31]
MFQHHTIYKRIFIGTLLLSLLVFLVPHVVFAQAADFGVQNVQDQGLGLSSQPLQVTVVKVIRAILGFLGLIAVIIVLYGGYVYMTAGGNEDKISQAKMILRNGVIGLTIILFSFAIVQFIITRFNQAAGGGEIGDTNSPLGCTDVVSCNFQDPCADIFVAQSITPNQSISGVNNIVIRAVFTKSVGTPAAEVFTILKNTIDVSRNFTYRVVPGTDKKVIEAVMSLGNTVSAECSEVNYVDGTECVPLGEYHVSINDTVVATDGEGISFGATACTSFDGMQESSFETPTEANDVGDPTWQGVGIINPETNSPFTDLEPRLPAGETYTFVGTTDDDNGVGYTQFHLEATDGSETPVDFFRGPSSGTFSDKAYLFSKELFFSSGIVRYANHPKQYRYTFITWDIDHHVSAVQTGMFVLVGSHCFNEVLDEELGETDIDIGGACGSDTICIEDYQCSSGLCVEGQCVVQPKITDVDPMDGAPGNWVTIRGYYFGNEEGAVEFGSDEEGWLPANIVECSGVLTGNAWNNTYVIAEVPRNADFAGTVTSSAIRITNSTSHLSDATNDDFGPKPVYTDGDGVLHPDGLFRFTNTTRPGLCAVVVDGDQEGLLDGVTAGPPGIRIRAMGRKFGTRGDSDNITFDIGTDTPFAASVFGWEDTVINTNVPLAVAPGNPLVHVEKNGVESNGVPFRVSRPDLSDVKPLITDIDPSDPTPGSFVTIFGAHFGQAGYVYISPNAGATCSHNNDADTCIELTVPPAPCQNTWTDTQIIIDIPDAFSGLGTYYVTVERADNGLSSDGTIDLISVQSGEAKPSICQLNPNQGPAILPDEHPGLVFSGKNFARGSTNLYFWNGAGDITNSTDVSNLDSDSWIAWGDNSSDARWGVSTDKKTITSSVGFREASLHPTMPLGRWPIAITANGSRGNSINYFVTDCRIQGSVPGDTALQCCTEGPDTGSWKTICEGDVRSSGYVWRFTTGIPPTVPYVLVQCEDDGVYKGKSVEASPVPSSEWAESEEMCINATAQVAVSMTIDPTTVTENTVLLYTCGSTTGDIDCTYTEADKVSSLDLNVQPGDAGSIIVIKKASDLSSPNFLPNTWYRVLLTTGIKTPNQDVGGGNSTSTALRIDEARVPIDAVYNDAEIAFSYDFQTGTGLCSLDSAYITPREKTVTQIGPLHDIYNVDLPFYYYLKGKADRACTLLNADGLGWNWSSNRTDKATISADASGDYKDTRATAAARQEAADGVTFSASTDFAEKPALQEAFPQGLEANTSTLFINIGPPHVVSFEPNCSESCPNAVVKATFSRHMDPVTYDNGGVLVYQCADPNCVNLSDVTNKFTIDSTSKLEVTLSPKPTSPLESNTYYKVSLTDNIKSVGGVALIAQDGQSLTPFSWIFRTKADNTLCGVDNIIVKPHPFIAMYIGQKTKFTATPRGAPNECNPRGQELSRTKYTYNWMSTVPVVASTTKFAASLTGSASFCTEACVPSGSDISFTDRTTPICGNGIVDAGEDCDIAGTGEILGLTCSLSCLRPGLVSGQTTCGTDPKVNNPQEHLLDTTIATGGEACDPMATIRTGSLEILLAPYCTNECLKKGSSSNFNPNTSGYCGDGFVGLEEACDIGIPFSSTNPTPNLSALGCNTSCLHQGTPILKDWCTKNKDSYGSLPGFDDVCGTAKAVCGNGEKESGEQCEAVNGVLPAHCSNTCTWENTCDSEGKICDPATDEGCTSSCLLGGSSLFYSTPSVCGDSVVGLGEYAACEIPGIASSTAQGALQLVTAIGEGQTVEGKQTTEIRSSIPSENNVTGIANYTLQCGFTEYEAPQNGFYNDCVLPMGESIAANGLGVATNSCCYQRSFRDDQYPAENEGFGGSDAPICRNTYIEVTFDAEVDPSTVADNAIIARGYESEVNCAERGGADVTSEVMASLGFADGSADAGGHGFWSNIWYGIKQFFQSIVQRVLAGNLHVNDMRTWCSEGSLTTDLDTPATTIPLYVPQLLGSQTSDTAYAVLLRGGKEGIRDIHGVGIKHKTETMTSDAWAFEVGTEICKIDHVAVDPSSYLFSAPNTSADFGVAAISKQGQQIVSTPAYSWRWEWQPQASTIFNIPVEETDATSQFIKMGSTNVEGTVTALAQAIVTADVSTTGNQLGNRFEGQVALTSMFCEHPWPARSDTGEWAPYVDETFNYTFSYCADAGVSGNTNDDLPFIQSNDIVLTSSDVLQRSLFVSDTNTDALGIQVFANPQRLSVASWFADKFPNAPIPQKVTITMDDPLVSGYDAIADQDNYYINAFNVVKDAHGNVTQVYSNIYLFTISQAAQASTRDVFQQILDTLEFNINLTDYRYCLGYDGKTPDFEHECTTNFDCLLGPQTTTIQQGQIGVCEGTEAQCVTTADCDADVNCVGGIPEEIQTYVSAGCSAEKTQLFRDVERLRDVETIQSALGNGPYPTLDNGTFRPNYVASVWSSWGLFGSSVGANLPRDPINVWSGCGPADAQTCWDGASSTFVCPQQESVYEYSYNKDTGKYTLHMPFEFFKSEAQIEQFFSPSFITDTAAFTTARECQPGQTYTFTASSCGDGVVGPGEQCDPPGKAVLGTQGTVVQAYGACSRQSDIQCLYDTDCAYTYNFNGKGNDEQLVKKVIYVNSPTGKYCVLTDDVSANRIVVDDRASDQHPYTLFSCKQDEDCNELISAQYVSVFNTIDIGAYDNPSSTFSASNEFRDYFTKHVISTACVSDDRLLSQQCIGAIPENGLAQCAVNQFATQTCNNSCQWDLGACEGNADCGNGRVDPGETCDDGGLNGQYGQCNTQCSGLFADYCGNERVDVGYEACDWSIDGYSMYATNADNACSWDCQSVGSYCGDGTVNSSDGEICDRGIAGVGEYNVEKTLSCSADCTNFGSYCGDGVVDTSHGEECDDGNSVEGDGCTTSCQLEKSMCSSPYPENSQECVVGQNMCPYHTFGSLENQKNILEPIPNAVCEFKDTICMPGPRGTTPLCIDYYHLLFSDQNQDGNVQVYSCTTDRDCGTARKYGSVDLFINIDNPTNVLSSTMDMFTPSYTVLEDLEYRSYAPNFVCQSSSSTVLNLTDRTHTYQASCPLLDVAPSIEQPPQQTTPISPACGNGVLDSGEQCDPVDSNTKSVDECTNLGYGQSCAYCSNTCRIETVDAQAYCGNEVLDQKEFDVYESCEQRSDGTILVRQSDGTSAVESCEGFEYGSISCTNSCSAFNKSCFNCGLSDTGASAKLSIVNPMLGKNNTFVADTFFRAYLNRYVTTAGVKNIRSVGVGLFGADVRGAMVQVGLKTGDAISDPIATIATQNVCSTECAGGDCAGDGYFVTFANTATEQGADKFAYNVSGQTTSVTNEYVTSPSVPQGSIRVVIRWSRAEENDGANMRGSMYSRGFTAPFLKGFSDAAGGNICKEATQQGNATIPAQCTPYENGMYVHPETGLENTFVQATTIDLDAIHIKNEEPLVYNEEPLAYVVRNESGPIAPWKNKNITVDVYTYHAGQTFNSIYAPTFSYTIKTSANTSSNATATWWHVFNLIPQDRLLTSELEAATDIEGTDFAIVPVESLETDDCELQNNMYTTQVDCSQ